MYHDTKKQTNKQPPKTPHSCVAGFDWQVYRLPDKSGGIVDHDGNLTVNQKKSNL